MEYLEGHRKRSSAESDGDVIAPPDESASSSAGSVLDRVPPRALPFLPLVLLLAAILACELAVTLRVVNTVLVPPPSLALRGAARLIASGELQIGLAHTLARTLIGFVIGGVPAVALGLAIGASARWRAIVDPTIAAVHAIPKVAIFPLILIVLGFGEQSKFALAAVTAFFPLLISTMSGVRQINPIHFEVARNYGAGARATFFRVLLPGSSPSILSGARIALNTALLVTIASEMLNSNSGLGRMIWSAFQTMRIEELYVVLFVISAIGIGLNLASQRIARAFAPWDNA